MRLAVIGGTAAGPAAAAEARRANPDAEVVLYEQSAFISVGSCEIPYFVGGMLGPRADLVVVPPEEFERTRGARVKVRHRVTALDPRRGTLVVEALDFGSRREERFDRFILATGARARRLGVEHEDAAGIFPVRTMEDALGLRDWVETERPRHAVVVGAGYIGIEMADVLRNRGLRVTLLSPSGQVLSATLDPAMSAPIEAAVRAHGVALRAERPVGFLIDGDGRVRAVRTDRGELIGCGLVVLGIGIEPNVGLAQAAGVALGATGAVAVDRHMRTNRPNVWACGDLVEVPRAPDGHPSFWPLAPVGRRTARVAARNAARDGRGTPERMADVTRAAAVRAFGIEAARVGLSEAEARAGGFDCVAVQIAHWSRTAMFPGAKRLHVRLVAERGSGRLLGGELVGEEGAALRANVLVPLVAHGNTVRELAEDLDLIYNPPVAPAVDPLRIAASAAWKAAQGRPGARGR